MTKSRRRRQGIAAKNPYVSENPKDLLAGRKLPLDLVPDSLEALAALGFLEGALKYGQFNWRVKPVRMSVYTGALKRHLKALRDGQWADPKTHVPHISSIIACAAIIGDANLCGSLKDDRPPINQGLIDFLDTSQDIVAHLKELFKNESPKQYTIADSIHSLPYSRGNAKEGGND